MRDAWEEHAENWVRWARTPGHDAYWWYSPGFFDELVPPPGTLTVELGCGEGRVARDLAARGHRVLGVDASPTLVRHARAAHAEGRYVVADATRLPLVDACADLVVAYNALMDVDDMPAAVAEAARVLVAGGRLCVSVTHPLADAGAWSVDGEVFEITGSYYGKRRVEDTVERDGLRMTFRGWCYPLEGYVSALEAAGLLVERLREPAARAEHIVERPELEPWRRIPGFLQLRAVKPAGPPPR
jgi:SAM-dependent methyltransferase